MGKTPVTQILMSCDVLEDDPNQCLRWLLGA